MRRVALKIAYIGTNFHGYQRQPEYRTVEGELLKVLAETEIITDTWKAHYSVAGRTDKGVHSTGNVISFITDKDIYINKINGLLPDDIKIIGQAKVPYGFKVRFPLTRTYTYIQPIDPTIPIDINKIKEAMNYFIGEHYFRNFSKRNEKNSYREIISMNLEVKENVLIFKIEGKSFLWNMVRKMITALLQVGYGEIEPDCIKKLLEPEDLRRYVRLRPSSASGLILSDVYYNNIKFEEYQYAKNKFIDALKKEYVLNYQKKEVDKTLINMLKE